MAKSHSERVSRMETWAPIDGYEGRYEISDAGHVRRQTFVDHRGVVHKARVMRVSYGSGYATFYGSLNGKRFGILVHRAIAIAFIPNPHALPHINHIDGNKRNNSITNLEWVTQQQNVLHAKRTGLWRQKLTNEDVAAIRREFVPRAKNDGKAGGNSRDLARRFSVTPEQVRNIASGRQWSWAK